MRAVRAGAIALDTACFIYWIEARAPHAAVLDPVFREVVARRRTAVTSALTLLEVRVVPLRAGQPQLARRYEELLTRSLGLRPVPIDGAQLVLAAHLRAAHPALRTPDALQVAAALSNQCGTPLTNDRRYPAIPGLRVVQIGEPA
jgi:predicted nucleic acid-binding protein